MKRYAIAIQRLGHTGLMVMLLALAAVPAWAQQGGGGSGGSVTMGGDYSGS